MVSALSKRSVFDLQRHNGWRLRWAVVFLLLPVVGCNRQWKSPSTSQTKSVPDAGAKRSQPPIAGAVDEAAFQGQAPKFVDVAQAFGVVHTHFNDEIPGRFFLPEVMGGGVGWLDYDRDGWYDLYFANGCPLRENGPMAPSDHVNGLFRNLGGMEFKNATAASGSGDLGYGQGIAVADYDADGFPDIFVANYGQNVLLHNNGDGTFSDVSHEAGVADDLWGTSAVWVDLNDDGIVDLYVANYLNVSFDNYKVCQYSGKPGYCGPGDYRGEPDRAYLNQGNGEFVESAKPMGLLADLSKGLAVVAADFDDDLKPEVYVANDMTPNFLFTRTAPLTRSDSPPSVTTSSANEAPKNARYRNSAPESGCAVSDDGEYEASMGVACRDFDGDGRPDLFLTHYFNNKNTLYKNLGGLLFVDDSRRTKIAATSFELLGFGTVALDYDLNGSLDLFVANGHVLGPRQAPHQMRQQLLCNDGRGRFSEVSPDAGDYFDELFLGRSAAGCDFDNDGDLDIAVTHLHRPVALLRNDTENPGRFIGLELTTPSRVPPIGGRVVVHFDDRKITVPILAGGSYLASEDPRLLVGLGEHSGPVDVTIYWPSGNIETFPEIHSGRYWRMVEGQKLEDGKPKIQD